MNTIHISKYNDKDFTSISAALKYLAVHSSEETLLFIHNGIYRERITVNIPRITFQGESKERTIITGNLSAREILPDGMKRGTFRSYSCLIDAPDFCAKNLTFENTAGPGPEAGQALALYVDGDRVTFDNCRFLGNQDTLFTGPLPPKEIEKNGFIGPKQFAPRINGRQYYKDCYIEGDIDFIFGSATAYFENCEFFSKNTGNPVNSYVTAASTPEGQEFGYVMDRCRFTGNCPDSSCYLGRPWRDFAKTVLLNCHIGPHICPEGWHDWNKPKSHETVFFAEYNSHGPGAVMGKRPSWVKQLTKEDAAHYLKENILGFPWNKK